MQGWRLEAWTKCSLSPPVTSFYGMTHQRILCTYIPCEGPKTREYPRVYQSKHPMIIPIKLCPITEIAFFLLTSPPCASPAAGVWSMTNVVAQSIQATSPELNVGCDSQQIRPTPSTNGPSHSNVAFQDERLRVFLTVRGVEGCGISPKKDDAKKQR